MGDHCTWSNDSVCRADSGDICTRHHDQPIAPIIRRGAWADGTRAARLDRASGRLVAVGDSPASDVRYLDVLPLPDGGYRLYYEARLPDDSHELRTELITPPGSEGSRAPRAGWRGGQPPAG
jgi:hypothetical protein